jgi:hypothetical protein
MERESSDDMSKSAASGGDAKHDVAVPAGDREAIRNSDDPITNVVGAPRNFLSDHIRGLFKELMECPPFYWDFAEGKVLEQPKRKPLPDAPDLLLIVSLLAIQLRDPLRTLISCMRARSDYLVACHEVHGERHSRPYMRCFGEQIRDSLEHCLGTPCRPLMLFLGWSFDKSRILYFIFANILDAEDNVSDWDCSEARHWAYLLEQEVLKPVEDLSREVIERLARLPAPTPSPDANACLLIVTVKGNSSKVEFRTPAGRKENEVDYDVAVFLREVHQAQGKPVTCKTINEQHGLALRVDRIIDKVPADLRPCFVTKKGAGTYFDWNAWTKLCQTLRVE